MNVKGLSIKDITNLDWEDVSKLTRKELASITSRLVSASNKRLKRLEQSDSLGESPALRSVKDRTGDIRFSVKGKTHGQLERVFKEAKHFLNLKTSTVSGYRNVLKNVRETIKTKIGRRVSDIDVSKLFESLHKAQELGLVDKRGSKGSDIAVGFIIDMLERNPDKSVDAIINEFDNYASNLYEEELLDYEDEDDGIPFDDEF